MNLVSPPTFDDYLQDLLRKEQRCKTQVIMEEKKKLSFGGSKGLIDIALYASNNGKQEELDIVKAQCYVCKEF